MNPIHADSVEVLAPAGDFSALQAAIDTGADAVYFGLAHFRERHGYEREEPSSPRPRRRTPA
ncbi:MAG: hypothetical protein IIC50_18245 [Planctomycetes bacterium]|nr:hypothetical protein [Planctomycetota bacterium]